MNNTKSQPEKKNNAEHISIQSFTKKIGSTTYIVHIHFNEQTDETLKEKFKLLIGRRLLE